MAALLCYAIHAYSNGEFEEEHRMPNRAHDWLNQALRDVEQAESSRQAGRHEWACFAAQQAAEKAVKALHLHLGQEAWGHVIAKLLRELPDETLVPEELVDKAHVLDAFYIPARYPNSHPEGAPFEHYGPLQSEEAIRYAREILEFIRAQMA
jgi:HEPN domain-containing protein